MKVYEINVKLYLVKNIMMKDISELLAKIIDNTLGKNKKFLAFHNKNCYKNYSFNSLYPLEQDKIYKADQIYNFQIRTLDLELAEFLLEELVKTFTDDVKVLKTDIKIMKNYHLEKIYSITPLIIKDDKGYWKNNISIEEYERRLKSNLFKKYKDLSGEQIEEDIPIFTAIEFKNRKPVAFDYKDIRLLGDKISLIIADDELSQKIAYMALGTGLGEMSARGAGFVNFRYL